MTENATKQRKFRVSLGHEARHHARFIDEVSFEAAALVYLDDIDATLIDSEDKVLRIHVEELDTGHEHCFRIDAGDFEACE